jgi:5'-nucleotidase
MLAKAMVRSLKYYEGCNLVICLSHLGFSYTDDQICDVKLAQQVKGIDVILGGHTHTFLDEPYIHRHDDGSLCCVHQVGFAGIRLGKIELLFNQDGKPTALTNASVTVKSSND